MGGYRTSPAAGHPDERCPARFIAEEEARDRDACERMPRYLAQIDVTRVLRNEIQQGVGVLTLFDLWRIERLDGGAVRVWRRVLATGDWEETRAQTRLPGIRLMPGRLDSNLPFVWLELQQEAIEEVQCQALQDAGVLSRSAAPADYTEALGLLDLPEWGLEGLLGDPEEVRDDHERYRQERQADDIMAALPRCYSRRLMRNAHAAQRTVRALGAALWRDVIDRETLSLAVRLWGARRRLFLDHYLQVAMAREAVLRVAEERPNLLPMLAHIHPDHWARRDLFSRRHWVRKPGGHTRVDRADFCASPAFPGMCRPRLRSFDSPGPFRFLVSLPPSVVAGVMRDWHQNGQARQQVARVLQLLQAVIPSDDPRPFARQLALLAIRECDVWDLAQGRDRRRGRRHVARDSRTRHGFSPELERLLRAWVRDQLERWARQGYRQLTRQLPAARRELSLVRDWFSREGSHQGLPDRHMRWPAIKHRSDDWHERMALQVQAEYGRELLTWSSPLPACERDGYRITPLTHTQALIAEGAKMHHCVGGYDAACHAGEYLVFAIESLSDGRAERATLGLAQVSVDEWCVDQVYSYCNRPVLASIDTLSRYLAREVSALTALASRENENGDPA